MVISGRPLQIQLAIGRNGRSISSPFTRFRLSNTTNKVCKTLMREFRVSYWLELSHSKDLALHCATEPQTLVVPKIEDNLKPQFYIRR